MERDQQPRVPGPLVGGPRPLAERSRHGLSRRRRLTHAVAAPLAAGAASLLWSSYRLRVAGSEDGRRLLESGEPVVLTLWHDGIFAAAPYLRTVAEQGVEVTYLVSPSADGDLVARVVRRIGGRVVRGSATRSGVKAMRELHRTIVRGRASAVVLPDGPHGPAHVCKEGVLVVARLSGAAVLPVGCAAGRQWRLRTWDRLRVPQPFARVRVEIGDPVRLPRDADEAAMAAGRRELEGTLERLERIAAAGLGAGAGP